MLLMTGTAGDPRTGVLGGFSIPMSFMVAFNLSRSLRSSSSSWVSSFRAPVMIGGAPGLRVKGRRFGGVTSFLSFPPNMEKLFQSNDMDRREARLLAVTAVLDVLLRAGEALALDGFGESKVVSRSI